MSNNILKTTFAVIFSIISVTQNCDDSDATIQFDYRSYPKQPFDFEHLELEVTLERDLGLVRGVASYEVSPKLDDLTELILQTEDSAIDAVTINDGEVEFEVLGDSLVINLPQPFAKKAPFDLAITWQSNSKNGLYLDHKNTFWSSKNPLAHQLWMPVFDHPTNEFTVDAHFVIPNGTEVMFNGELLGSEAQGEDKKRISYRSQTPVPATGLGFAMGDFIISEVASGLTTIRLFANEREYPEEKRIELIREASELKKDIERELSMEYPWEGLNIIILSDNFWEERTHGTGTIYLYERLGDLSTQLKRGIYAQWFGEYHREQQFFDWTHAGDEFMRKALHYLLGNTPETIENPDSLYTIQFWNSWQEDFDDNEEVFLGIVLESLPHLVREKSGIVDFEEYMDYWYSQTGVPFSSWSTSQGSQKEDNELEDSDLYQVDVLYDELSSQLDLVFELKEGSGEELHTLFFNEIGFADTIAHEATFTGALDTVSMALSNSVEFISFTSSENIDKVTFDEFPLFFLLNQLRSQNLNDRVFAAELISSHSENPDLQLALNDVMAFESDPEVKAALLSTMADITYGASGTQQQFLDELNNTDISIQTTAIEALLNYPEDEMVSSALRNKVLRAEDPELFTKAFEVYKQLADSGDIVTIAQRLQRVDTTGAKVLEAIEASADIDTLGTYVTLAESYLSDTYPYPIRKHALELLIELDEDEQSWVERIEELSNDRDPRIRIISLDAMKWLSMPAESFDLLTALFSEERDIRVLLKIDDLLDEASR
ncbi:MAG: hypothetical protein ED557_02550 [Balneola sp.]|nr:MAG: hypothetical protein ED557_02550 [Balneola sp.]